MSAKAASPYSVKPNQILVLEPSGELKFKGVSSDSAITVLTTPRLLAVYIVPATRTRSFVGCGTPIRASQS